MAKMSEERIERWVERQVDSLDRRYTGDGGKLTEAEYKRGIALIDGAAERAHSMRDEGDAAIMMSQAQQKVWELGA